jgi:predicted ribosomally synthesized peptide with nif11-like leader
MSMSDAEEFLRLLTSDPDLARQDAAARRRELVKLAKERGFEVTEEDLAEAARAAQMGLYGDVDDAALDSVVGGCEECGQDCGYASGGARSLINASMR